MSGKPYDRETRHYVFFGECLDNSWVKVSSTVQSRKRLIFETAIVFALSLGASAIYSVVSLIAKLTSEAGLAGQSATLNESLATREWLDLTYQLLGIAFGLAPVTLALFLLWQNHANPFAKIGLTFNNFKKWVAIGLVLAAAIGIPGLALYISARALGLSARIIPAELPGYWWAIPVLLLSALRAGLLEEVLVVAYLFDRLEALGLSNKWQLVISSLLRGSYHLYQGFGGFVGNAIMGFIFGLAYKHWSKVMPLVIAHFILDAVSFVGFALFAKYLPL